ncbi:MAG: serine/threonine-protein kinase, partial [Myxococcota bacterium]
TKLGRRVAVKVLHERTPDESARILDEARATARCIHENIVVIHEVDEYRGHPFMVLEYLSGQPLSAILAGAPLPFDRAIDLIVPVVRALACAHEQGIVHRDLKPENIVVTNSGMVKVLDFGIAKMVGRSESKSTSKTLDRLLRSEAVELGDSQGSLTGTLPYMSPEQWGKGEVDHRTDLWAVGILLFVALPGRHPLEPLSMERLQEIPDLDRSMPSIRQAGCEVPDELARVIDLCLAKRRDERMPSAERLLAALEPLLPYGRQLGANISPYAGLAAFKESDAGRFFGRSRDVAALIARLRDRPLVGVVGPSGVGKSSFISAGVIPALKNSGEAWESLTMRPGRHPLTALAHAITAVVPDDKVFPTGQSRLAGEPAHPGEKAKYELIRDRLRHEPGYLGTILRARARERKRRILLYIDQFEELYTLVADAEERAQFTASLLGMADDAATPLRVIVSARSDFLDRAAENRAFMTELTQGLWFLTTPDRAGLQEALTLPAE